jgi:hypothetical protein
MRLGVVLGGQHVHELGALGGEARHLVAVDRGRHLESSS